jgi:hypothetical protein
LTNSPGDVDGICKSESIEVDVLTCPKSTLDSSSYQFDVSKVIKNPEYEGAHRPQKDFDSCDGFQPSG